MSEGLLSRARAGDQDAFGELVDPYRHELQVHCYRIVGSVQDAEDMVQETLLAAWRGLAGFEERSSVRAWLYRIATNRCLNALRDAGRRQPPPPEPPPGPPEPTCREAPVWLEPYPDVLLEGIADTAPGPEARYEARETIELAFIAALQHLPPRQRAVLVLRDVLGFPAAETAAMLDGTVDSVKGALKRARATLEQRLPAAARQRPPVPRSAQEHALVQRFADAFEADDIDGLVALLTGDAWFTMPPVPLQYQGPEAIAAFLRHWAAARGARRLRLVPTRANTQPAFGLYLRDQHAPVAHAAGLLVLTLHGDQIAALTCFPDTSALPRFGLPRTLPDYPGRPDRVSASGRIDAPAHRVFLIVSDPARHVEIDGSGMLQAAPGAKPLTAVGDTFDMDMDRRPLGDIPNLAEYKVRCTVTQLIPDRLVEWTVRAVGKPPAGHVYGWQIEPEGDTACLVTNYCDWTGVNDQLRARFSWPVVPVDKLEKSIGNLKRIASPNQGGA